MKKHFNRELVMTKKDAVDFESSSKCWIFDNGYVDGDVTLIDHCLVTGKCRGSEHRDCNIKGKLSHKIPVVCHNLSNYDSHLIVQELCKFYCKKNVIPNGLEKYISFNINNKLAFVDSF